MLVFVGSGVGVAVSSGSSVGATVAVGFGVGVLVFVGTGVGVCASLVPAKASSAVASSAILSAFLTFSVEDSGTNSTVVS